jgi:hypothetical protein
MNAILLIGIIALAAWYVQRRADRPRKRLPASDDAFSHALRPDDNWSR